MRKDFPANSVKELIDYVKANPGKVVFGSQGNGATPHLTANMFMNLTGTKMIHVPYRGETLVLQDMLGLYPRPSPKFSKNFMEGAGSIEAAVKAYVEAVRGKTFPGPEHSY